jgi:DNA-binding MurR/RpiR family transcriptional regulator
MEAGVARPSGRTQEESSPLVRIRSLLPGLAKAEQRVAQVVLADPATVAHLSITEVAGQAGTSETTVTRFCKAIGVGGYPELRLALAEDSARTAARVHREVTGDITGDITAEEPLADVVAKVAFADARAVEETAAQLDIAALDAVVGALAAAPRVDIYGVGSSAVVALDLQQKLQRIGRIAFAFSDVHMALVSAAMLGEGDVAVGISHTGTTTDTLDMLAEARRRGAYTVAITSFSNSPITEVARLVLTAAARETRFRSGSMSSRVAQLTVVDCLIIGVAQRQLDVVGAALRSTGDALNSRRTQSRSDRRRSPHLR